MHLPDVVSVTHAGDVFFVVQFDGIRFPWVVKSVSTRLILGQGKTPRQAFERANKGVVPDEWKRFCERYEPG